MKKIKKIALMTLLISISLVGCEEKPDAYLCTTIIRADVRDSILYCRNLKTKETKEINIANSHKYICASPNDYESIYENAKKNCKNYKNKSYDDAIGFILEN